MRAINFDERAAMRDRRPTLSDVRYKVRATIEPVAPWVNDLFAFLCVAAFVCAGFVGLSFIAYLIGGHVS